MGDSPKLNRREADFCRYYVGNNGNGTDAAKRAGYSPATARVQASQLLRRPHIAAEIERLRAAIRASAAKIMGTAVARKIENIDAISGEVIPPDQHDAIKEAVIAGLTRAYVIANLMEIVDIGMGKRPTISTKIVKAVQKNEDGEMTETVNGVAIEVSERDLGAAVRALELLEREATKKEEANFHADNAVDVTPAEERHRQMEDLLRPFRLAVAAGLSSKMNGHANGASNGATNGSGKANGHG
jgi:hypothetical protein